MSKLKTTTGLALAVAAAGLMGCATTQSTGSQVSAQESVHCYGVNKCSGHNDCKTADNACAGHGACKGQGFVTMSAKACGDVGGKVGS